MCERATQSIYMCCVNAIMQHATHKLTHMRRDGGRGAPRCLKDRARAMTVPSLSRCCPAPTHFPTCLRLDDRDRPGEESGQSGEERKDRRWGGMHVFRTRAERARGRCRGARESACSMQRDAWRRRKRCSACPGGRGKTCKRILEHLFMQASAECVVDAGG